MTLFIVLLPAILAGVPEAPRSAAPSPVERSEEQADGEALFHVGVKAYDRHHYSEAIQLFEIAYNATHIPAILFDIAQAYRAAGDCRHSLEALNSFLDVAPSDDSLRSRVRAQKAELGDCLETHAFPTSLVSPISPAVSPVPSVTAAVAVVAGASKATVLPAVTRFIDTRWGKTCFAAGTGTLTLGAIELALGLEARSLAGTVEESRAWTLDVQRTDARGQTFAEVSEALLLGTGVAAAITAFGCWAGWREARRYGRPELGSNGR